MRRVRCYDCGKIYDFDVDDFCPRCGAFNQPRNSSAIDARGAVVRVDGISERGHAGSFVHEEFHEENRERKRMGLSKSVRRTAKPGASTAPAMRNFAPPTRSSASGRTSAGKSTKNPAAIIVKVIAAIIIFNVLCNVLGLILFW